MNIPACAGRHDLDQEALYRCVQGISPMETWRYDRNHGNLCTDPVQMCSTSVQRITQWKHGVTREKRVSVRIVQIFRGFFHFYMFCTFSSFPSRALARNPRKICTMRTETRLRRISCCFVRQNLCTDVEHICTGSVQRSRQNGLKYMIDKEKVTTHICTEICYIITQNGGFSFAIRGFRREIGKF